MKFVKPSCSLVMGETPTKHLELVGRTCYKSEDKIKDGTDIKMIGALRRSGHFSVLEHYYFCLCTDYTTANTFLSDLFITKNPLRTQGFRYSYEEDGLFYFSINPRRLLEWLEQGKDSRFKFLVKEMIAEIEYNYPSVTDVLFPKIELSNKNNKFFHLIESSKVPAYHRWHTFRFITNRGVSHELVRHRVFSFAQESTRYVNYNGDMVFCFSKDENEFPLIANSCALTEFNYTMLDLQGVHTDIKREVLPNIVKTEVCMTGFDDYWTELVLPLRYEQITGKVHPEMLALMNDFVDKYGMSILHYNKNLMGE